MGVITLTTDFGSFYPAIMKATILTIAPDVSIVDITHSVTPHSIREGAFILREAVKHFPRGTVHVAVIDPTVGTKRRCLLLEAGGHYLVGPDNGLLIPAARALGTFDVHSVQMAARSHTFHGRDVFAPVGARISTGRLVPTQQESTFVDLTLDDARLHEGAVFGAVVYVDRFGNCITNIRQSLLAQLGGRGSFLLNGQTELRLVTTYDEVAGGVPLLVLGSFELLEIAVNGDSAAQRFGLKVGDAIVVTPR